MTLSSVTTSLFGAGTAGQDKSEKSETSETVKWSPLVLLSVALLPSVTKLLPLNGFVTSVVWEALESSECWNQLCVLEISCSCCSTEAPNNDLGNKLLLDLGGSDPSSVFLDFSDERILVVEKLSCLVGMSKSGVPGRRTGIVATSVFGANA